MKKIIMVLLFISATFFSYADIVQIHNETSSKIALYVNTNKCYNYDIQNFTVEPGDTYYWYDSSRANCAMDNSNIWIGFHVFSQNSEGEWGSIGYIHATLDKDTNFPTFNCGASTWEDPYGNPFNGASNTHYIETRDNWCIDNNSGLINPQAGFGGQFMPHINSDNTPLFIFVIDGV